MARGWSLQLNVPMVAFPRSESIVTLAFDTTKQIFNQFPDAFWDVAFVDGVNALVEFVINSENQTINMEVCGVA